MSGLKHVADTNRAIESLRASLKRAGIPETRFRATWDREQGWATLRARVEGRVEWRHRVEVEKDGVAALVAAAKWLASRALRVKRGEAYDVVFADVVTTSGVQP